MLHCYLEFNIFNAKFKLYFFALTNCTDTEEVISTLHLPKENLNNTLNMF